MATASLHHRGLQCRAYAARWRRMACFAGVLVFAMTSAAKRNADASEAFPSAEQALTARLDEVRAQAWQTALDITSVYEKISPESCPGIAALVNDIRVAQRKVDEPGIPNLDRLNSDALIAHNPHFWRAALEISPADGSLLLLQATLLASAGEVWRAYRVLGATTQLLPLSAGTRPYYLTHLYGLGSVVALAARAGEYSGESPAAIFGLERELTAWPGNAIVLNEILDLRMHSTLAEERKWAGVGGQTALQAELRKYHDEVDRLFALDPIRAAIFRGDAVRRAGAQRLNAQWSKMTDSETVLGYKEVRELGDALEAAQIPDLALVIRRIEVVARGFPGPSDLAAWHRLLPELIGDREASKLFAAADRGEIRIIDLEQGDAVNPDDWKGDPAIHPLVLQQVQREIADLSFRIAILNGNPAVQAETYRQRALQQSRAGLYEAALGDVEKAISVVGRKPDLLLDEVGMYAALGYSERAENLLREAEATGAAGQRLALREKGLLRFAEGRYSEAVEALRDDARRNPRAVYSALIAELAARRVGGSQQELLQTANRQIPAGSWLETCLAFLTGKISEDKLVAEAQRGDSLEIAQRFCEAYFILGETALATGDRAKAIDLLESCVGTGITGYVEFRLARQELRRLGADALPRGRPSVTPRGRPHETARPPNSAPHEDDPDDDALPA